MNERVRAIVVTYDSRATLERCLASIAAQEGVRPEVVVVDNASRDGTVDWLRRHMPHVRVLASPDNLGFGAANNRAFDDAAADPGLAAFALVNPDATLPRDAFRVACDRVAEDPAVGVVGLRHAGEDGRAQASAFPFLGLQNLCGETFGLDRLAPGKGWSTQRPAGFDPERAQDVDWVQGSCLFVRPEVVRACGGFDPAYFMYGEDMEWCWRVRHGGYRIVYLPRPSVVHRGGGSAGDAGPRLFVEHWKGRLRFFDLHRGAYALLVARVLATVSIGGRWLLWEMLRAHPGSAARRATFRAAMGWVLSGQPFVRARTA